MNEQLEPERIILLKDKLLNIAKEVHHIEQTSEHRLDVIKQLQAENKRLGNEIFRYNDELSDSLTKIKQLQAENKLLQLPRLELVEQLQAENEELIKVNKQKRLAITHALDCEDIMTCRYCKKLLKQA